MRLLAALAACALTACLPHLIWTGHTADRRHRIEIVRKGDYDWIVVDGLPHSRARRIDAWSLATAGDRIVYAATRGAGWVVVDDGRPGPVWDGVAELVVAGAHTAYAAERAGRWRVVVDGRAGAAWDAILAGTLQFSRDTAHVAYVAHDTAGDHVVIDGRAGPAYAGIAHLVLADDGAHVAYAARIGEAAFVVADGVAGPRYRMIARLELAGARAVYTARGPEGWYVVAGAPAGPYESVHDLVVRGAHAAWHARDASGDVVACDGAVVARAPAIADDRLAAVDGCDVAYVVPAGAGVQVVARGVATRYDEVGRLVVGAGGHLAFAARRGRRWQIVVDGRGRGDYVWAGDPVFDATGAHVGFVARRAGRWLAVVDDRAFAFDTVVDGSLAFSRDGRRWAVIAGDLAHKRLFFAVDGVRRVPLASAELYAAFARRASEPLDVDDDGSSILRAWSAAEADKR